MSQASNQSPTINTAYVTSVNSINFPNNVLPTATLNVGYCNQQANVRTFFDTGSHRSFISPEVVKRLNLRVIKQVPMGILPESFSPSERETISLVRSNMEKSELGYIVRLPFKDDTRPSVNYRTVLGS